MTTAVETQIIQRKVLLRGTADAGVRRFTVAVVAGVATVLIPYLWVLCDLWNSSPSLLRTAESDRYASNFYDLQARAMFHGHLSVANGALGGEAFIHDGRQYTYFGIFPSLLRMPVLLLTHSLDGRLTAPSMLLAWLVTAAFSSLLVWRVRLLVRGRAALSWTEAGSYGVLLATIMGGSILIYLASDPDVFHEDLAWSVALTVASTFALLGVLERPSWRRVNTEWRPGSRRESRPSFDRLRVCDRWSAGRHLVRHGSWRRRQPPLVGPDLDNRRPCPNLSWLRHQLCQVRSPLWLAHIRSTVCLQSTQSRQWRSLLRPGILAQRASGVSTTGRIATDQFLPLPGASAHGVPGNRWRGT